MPHVPTPVRTGFRALSAVTPSLAVRVGARLFWRVGPPAAVRPADAATHARAELGHLDVGGTRVATYRWGDPQAPAVLLVHGWQARASRLSRLVDALGSAGMRVVAFDGVAHGGSSGRYASAFDHVAAMHAIQEVEGSFAAVVGHSLGGLSAGIALHEGLRADRFVSVSAPASFDALAATFLHLVGIPAALHDRFCAHVERAYPGDVTGARARIDLTTRTVPPTVATLLVHDDDDRRADPAGAQRLHAAHPGSVLLTTRGLGHNRIIDDDAVLGAVVAHLTSDRGAPVAP